MQFLPWHDVLLLEGRTVEEGAAECSDEDATVPHPDSPGPHACKQVGWIVREGDSERTA